MIRGIDDKRRLLEFFGAKEHRNLVLRIVDVLELPNDQVDHLIHLVGKPAMLAGQDGWRKRHLLNEFPAGWIVLPLDALLEPMELEDVQKLQSVVYQYADIRRQKGEPNRVEPCPRCRGQGRFAGSLCKDCQGDGKVITFVEMSEDEKELARG